MPAAVRHTQRTMPVSANVSAARPLPLEWSDRITCPGSPALVPRHRGRYSHDSRSSATGALIGSLLDRLGIPRWQLRA